MKPTLRNKLAGPCLTVVASLFAALPAIANPLPASGSGPVSEMVIEDITCEGNDSTDCGFITRKYYQKVGDHVDPEEIADARFRLGAEILFRNVSARLEKGSRRGYVIVVFVVQEANHIQYSYSTGFSKSRSDFENAQLEYYLKSTGDGQSLGSQFGVTDFNFLGSGKRLGLNFVFSDSERSSQDFSAYGYPDTLTNINASTTEQHSRRVVFNLSYFDPYLFSSPRYYLYGNLGFGLGRDTSRADYLFDDNPMRSHDDSADRESTTGEFEIGRRIASWSYISLITAYGDMDGGPAAVDRQLHSNYRSASLNYGWNTEDDTIFPTEGSVLRISLRGTDYKNRYGGLIYNEGDWYIGADYLKHFRLSDRNILTLGGGTVYDPDPNETRSSVSVNYTRMNAVDRINGRYSGWFVESRFSQLEEMLEDYEENYSYSVTLGYTRQTDQVVLRFQASYSASVRNGQ